MMESNNLIENYLSKLIIENNSVSSKQILEMHKSLKEIDSYFRLLSEFRILINTKIKSTYSSWANLESNTIVRAVKILSSRTALEDLGKKVKNDINIISSPKIVSISESNYEIQKEIRNIASTIKEIIE